MIYSGMISFKKKLQAAEEILDIIDGLGAEEAIMQTSNVLPQMKWLIRMK